jgi:polysaccharide biosynthesis/export protein
MSGLGSSVKRNLSVAMTVSILMPVVAACRPSLPDAPMVPQADGAFSAPQQIVPPGLEEDPALPFALMPGDVIHLTVRSLDTIDLPNLAVDGTGSVSVPNSGTVSVEGLSLDGAAGAIERELRRLDRFAQATVTLTLADGHRATIIGAVGTPGVYVLRPGARIADLVAQAGGLRTADGEGTTEIYDLADADAARLVRDGDALPLSVSEAIQGTTGHNVRVQPMDLLYVPPMRGSMISVLGSVNEQSRVPFHKGMRLTQALADAGGNTREADNGDIRIIRGPLSSPQVYRASLRALWMGEATDVVLQKGDIIYVTEDSFVAITDVLTRLAPLLTAAALAQTAVSAGAL